MNGIFQMQEVKLLRRYAQSESTVKAPNFDRVFTQNIFFLHIFYRWHPLEKFDRMYKIRDFVMSKMKILIGGLHRPPKKHFPGCRSYQLGC
jgi:hypothetical protein